MAATLFLGGYGAPLPWLTWIPSWAWFMAKIVAWIFFLIWIRGTIPRLRMDQLMNFAWKFLLPLSLINLVVVALWHFMGPGIGRWILCSVLVTGSYVLLGRGLASGGKIGKRTYRFAS